MGSVEDFGSMNSDSERSSVDVQLGVEQGEVGYENVYVCSRIG